MSLSTLFVHDGYGHATLLFQVTFYFVFCFRWAVLDMTYWNIHHHLSGSVSNYLGGLCSVEAHTKGIPCFLFTVSCDTLLSCFTGSLYCELVVCFFVAFVFVVVVVIVVVVVVVSWQVYHLTLHDIQARGYVRPFCLAYLTMDER